MLDKIKLHFAKNDPVVLGLTVGGQVMKVNVKEFGHH